MEKRISPQIYYSVFCSAFLLAVVVLLGSTFVLAHTPDTNTVDSAAAAQRQAGGQQVQLEGELEILHQDFKDHGLYFYSLKLADGTRVPLHFTKQPPTHLLTGDHVRANGQMSGGSLILYSGSTSLTKTTTTSNAKPGQPPPPPPPSIPVPYTFGAQSTLVMLVNFQDDAVEPYAVADAQNAYFSTASSFFMENSYQQTSLTGSVVGWYTIPESVTTCNMSQIAADAQNAAVAAGANLSNYTRYVYAFPQNTACGFAGSSYVGGNPSQSWINGNSLDIHVIDHELGHAFGLWHAHLYDCGTAATICSSPNIIEYGDPLDVMGVPQTAGPDYNAYQKERLGWLNYGASPSIQTVTASGTYTINPYEIGGSGPNALKIWKSTDPTTGAMTWYYIEARQAVGFDAFLANPIYYTQNETTGVLFHIGTDGDGNTSDLLDMTPATPTYYGWFDPSLVVGQSFQDPAAGVTLTTESVTSAGAAVSVQFSGSANLTVATDQTNYSPGQTVSTTASATNNGSPVANVSVSFVVTKSDGSQVTNSAKTGRNGIAVYQLKLKQSDPPGTYIAGAAATIKGNARSASTDFTLQ